jgi:hypothetical protein
MLKKYVAFAAGITLGALTLVVYTGCTVDSANGTARSVGINVAGIYRYDSSVCGNEGRFVSVNSGRPVSYFDLRQVGDKLEAIDNNGIIFRGTIGNVQDTSASFNLEGATTIGSSVVVSGNISVSGNKGTMQATWIENNFFATLCGSSTGQSIITNAPPNTNTNTNISIPTSFYKALTPEMQMQLAAYRQLAWWNTGS